MISSEIDLSNQFDTYHVTLYIIKLYWWYVLLIYAGKKTHLSNIFIQCKCTWVVDLCMVTSSYINEIRSDGFSDIQKIKYSKICLVRRRVVLKNLAGLGMQHPVWRNCCKLILVFNAVDLDCLLLQKVYFFWNMLALLNRDYGADFNFLFGKLGKQ